jgi:hypothetical protein
MEAITFGAWTVRSVDESGRRAWAICRCGVVRQLALEALQSGESQSCGCINSRSTRAAQRPCAEAGDGHILVDGKVRAALADAASLNPAGDLALKGFHRPVPAFYLHSIA